MSIKSFLIIFLILFSVKCGEENALIKLLKSFLQNYVDNDTLIKFIEIIRGKEKHNFENHLSYNTQAFKNHLSSIRANKGFIEDQSNYKDMKYGLKTLNENGCGLIATYNVIHFITGDTNINFPAIIDYFEKDGILLSGYFGTSIVAISEYFKKNGYQVMKSTKKAEYDNIGNNMKAFILMVYNDKDDITAAMHFMAITKSDGKYYVHNNGYKSSSVAYTSISDVLAKINSGKAEDVMLIGMSK